MSLAELIELLSEPVEDAQRREFSTLAQMAGDRSGQMVLFGAGGLGRRTLAGLRQAGVEPLAFSDNNRALWGTTVNGLEVISPDSAARNYGTIATFVVSIWGAGSPHRFEHSEKQLRELGCDCIVPFTWLAWRYPAEMLPYYAIDLPSRLLTHADEVRACFDRLEDEQSREEYVAQVKWRLNGMTEGLSHPDSAAQYFAIGFSEAGSGEVVLDCGAFDGDTLRAWLATRGANFAAYFAMEPDPESRERLQRSLSTLPSDVARRIRVLPYATGNLTGSMSFESTGSTSSSSVSEGGTVVDAIRLDDLSRDLEGHSPTFVKFDIEGAEMDALIGGQAMIRKNRPLLAISVYHRQNDIWQLLLQVDEMVADYCYFLRPHNEEGFDLILYAIPKERLAV